MKNTFLLHPQWTWAGFLCTSLDLNPEPPTQSQRVILVSYLSGNMSLTASPDESDDQFNNQLCIRGKLHLRPLSSLSCQHVYTWCSGLQLQFGSCGVVFGPVSCGPPVWPSFSPWLFVALSAEDGSVVKDAGPRPGDVGSILTWDNQRYVMKVWMWCACVWSSKTKLPLRQ